MRLSILIPTTPDRQKFMEVLFKQFAKQLGEFDTHVEGNEADGFWGLANATHGALFNRAGADGRVTFGR